jgi:hypothetical protein
MLGLELFSMKVQMTPQGGEFVKHALLVLGLILMIGKFFLVPLGLPASYLYPEIFICAVFLWIGLLDIATPLGATILTAIIVVVLLIL